MTVFYVDSAAGGANNGTSWTDAWTSILSADGAATAAGDEVRIDDGHSETGTIGTLAFAGTLANPLKILCVDKADDSLSTGAAIVNSSGAMSWQGFIQVDGLVVEQTVGSLLQINNSVASQQTWRNSVFRNNGSSNTSFVANTRSSVTLIDCTIDFASGGSASAQIAIGTAGASNAFLMRGGTITARAAGHTSLFNVTTAVVVLLDGVAIENTITNFVVISTAGDITLRRCKIPSYTNLVSAAITTLVAKASLESCVSGTISVPPLGLTHSEVYAGTIKSSLARYRTGGADDGEQANAHSWEMVSNANALEQVSWLESPPLTGWVDAGDGQTVTVYVASGVTLQDDEFWIEVLSPNETDSPSTTAQGRYQSTRLPFRGTPANLTTDGTSTWNGTGVSVLQKITVTINPAVAGPVTVRCCLAKPSTTVYVDPLLDVA